MEVRDHESSVALQAFGVLVPNVLGALPRLDVVLDDDAPATLEFRHLGEVELTPEQQRLVRTFHDFLIHR